MRRSTRPAFVDSRSLSVTDVEPGDINLVVNFNDVFTVAPAFIADPVVPTVSDWGLAAVLLLLLTSGTILLRRRNDRHSSGSLSTACAGWRANRTGPPYG